MRIRRRALLVIGHTIDILAPFGNVAVKVANSEAVRLLLADRMRLLVRIVSQPGVLPEPVSAPEIIGSIRSRTAGILPFRFGWQTVTVRTVIAIPVHGLFVVAGL